MRICQFVPAVLLLALPSPALSASADYFLKLGGVKGESADKRHKDWIDVHSFTWGGTRAVDRGGTLTIAGASPPASAQVAAGDLTGDGRAKGRPVIRIDAQATGAAGEAPLGLAAPRAKGSVTLLVPAIQRCRAGLAYASATIEGGGKRYRLEKLVIAQCVRAEPAEGGRPMESISFNYSKVSW